jgi:hypothetical protein
VINPLLFEFDESSWCGKSLARVCQYIGILSANGDLNGKRIAAYLLLAALTTSTLSVLSDAAAFKVVIERQPPNQTSSSQIEIVSHSSPVTSGNTRQELKFGYLYELNAAFFYLVCAPMFALYGARFLRAARVALELLAREKRLRVRQGERSEPVFLLVRNRRLGISWTILLFALIVGLPVVMYHAEFKKDAVIKDAGDYYRLAFGYLQAERIKSYLNKTLATVKSEHPGLELSSIPANDFKNWKVTAVLQSKNRLATHDLKDYVFWVAVIGIQSLFIPFALWIVLKAVYLFYFLFRAVRKKGDYPVQVVLDPGHYDNRFGLGLFDRAFNSAAILVAIGSIGANAAYVSNVAKGSHAVIGSPVAFGGQVILSMLPLVISGAMALFTILFHLEVEEQSDEEALNRGVYPEKYRQQSAWPSLPVLGVIGVSSFLLLLPPFHLDADIVKKISDSWVVTIDKTVFALIKEEIHE